MKPTLAKIGPYLGRFLELRLRAFIYALFALVGFMLGIIVHSNMSVVAIDQYEQSVKAALVKAHNQ